MNRYILFSLFFVFLNISPLSANDTYRNKIRRITSLKEGIDVLKREILSKESELKREKIEPKKEAIEFEIGELRDRLDKVEIMFADMASDSNLFSSEYEKMPEKRKLLEEVQEVLTPLVESFKRMSERPRKIEKLRYQISQLNEGLDQARKGVENIDVLLREKGSKRIFKKLKSTRQKVAKLKEELNLRLNILQGQLDEELKGDKSILESGKEVISDFFAHKGKNLIISITIIFLIFGFMFLLKITILRPFLYSKRFYSVAKPVRALYGICTVFLSILGGLLSLFLLNDWLLFTIFVLILATIIWSSRHFFTGFIGAIRLMLGFGTVREGERITLEGCSWFVKRIGMRTTLVNKALEGGLLKVDIKKILNLDSRKIVKDEPWFPTKVGDWVLLQDGTYGQVTVQTPEQVVLVILGAARKFYSLVDFISQKPQNLSDGFTILSSIGLDYGVQRKIFEIIEVFRRELILRLRYNKPRRKLYRKSIEVSLKEAGESSLNLVAKVTFKGSMAPHYLKVQRELQSILVDICNEHNLKIPFNQLSVHIEDRG